MDEQTRADRRDAKRRAERARQPQHGKASLRIAQEAQRQRDMEAIGFAVRLATLVAGGHVGEADRLRTNGGVPRGW